MYKVEKEMLLTSGFALSEISGRKNNRRMAVTEGAFTAKNCNILIVFLYSFSNVCIPYNTYTSHVCHKGWAKIVEISTFTGLKIGQKL